MKCISEMHGAATSHASPASESWQSDVLFYTQFCMAFLVRARWAYFLETLLYFEKIQYATRDLPSVVCQITPDRFNCGRQIFFFDEAYRKIVRVLKTGLAGICCVYKQSASVCASCVRIGGDGGGGCEV